MKILFLAHRIPYPPDKGEKIRAYEELRFLAQRHSVDLFCFAESPEESAGASELARFCRRVIVHPLARRGARLRMVSGLFRREPLSVAYFRSAGFAGIIAEALTDRHYDAVFVYCSSMAQYVRKQITAPIITDFVDADSAKWVQYARSRRFPASLLYRREATLLAQVERELAERSAASIATTERELSLVGGMGVVGTAIANGVRVPPAADRQPSSQIRRLQPYAVFIGQMDYYPNVDAAVHFAEEILPRVRRDHNLNFVIAGRNPSAAVRRLARQPGVFVTGAVPEVGPYLLGSSVAVAPFRISQGIHNKILEAVAAGVPVVSTSRAAAAFEDLREAISVADDPGDFAAAVLEICKDPGARQCSLALRSLLRERFDWDINLQRLERLLEEVVLRDLPAERVACT